MLINLKMFIVIVAYESASAAVSGDCVGRHKDENKIRIGFLSRYKSSKVSFSNA